MAVFLGPVREDDCPRCGQTMACGWWCCRCKMSKDYAGKVTRMNRLLSEPSYFPIALAAITAALIVGGIVYRIFS